MRPEEIHAHSLKWANKWKEHFGEEFANDRQFVEYLKQAISYSIVDYQKLINKSVSEKLHDSYSIQSQVEDVISEAFMEHEPEIYEKLDFHITSDYYDNSIEIYFDVSLPYPYEPSKEVRQVIYDLGFSIVYWNFLKDVLDVPCNRVSPPPPNNIYINSPDEIRGYEPRHSKYSIWIENKYGYVDDRFNEQEWKSKYNFKNK